MKNGEGKGNNIVEKKKGVMIYLFLRLLFTYLSLSFQYITIVTLLLMYGFFFSFPLDRSLVSFHLIEVAFYHFTQINVFLVS